jgi:hypothetical protein
MLMRKKEFAPLADMPHGWYTPEMDGDIKDYLEKHDFGHFPIFKGFEQYKMLWERGLFTPDVSVIRLVWGSGGGQTYLVKGLHEIDGYSEVMEAHAAMPGIHDPEKILEELIEGEQVRFEAHWLAREPIPRI